MHDLPLIRTLAAGFTVAWVLGLFTQWLRLSPIVGYLIAGVLIGPHTPGFIGDVELAHQLAEVGVILLMFGVGLHFHLGDLLAVKSVAIPGALGQSLVATIAGVVIFWALGMELKTGAVIGMAMAVASTVVLMRVLMDADALSSPAGHVAVGWLLVEDVLTVIVLVLIPALGTPAGQHVEKAATSPWLAILIALAKLVVLVLILMVAGAKFIPWTLTQVARLRSRELFTLTVMVFSVAIAAGAYAAFGASMALGAFLAGMVVAQSPVSHQAAADALPLRDAFAVLFFVAVGMLFDPMYLLREPLMVLAGLVIILVVKPLIALFIVAALGHSVRTALTVAIGLAQIGEFSFILSNVAREYQLMPESAHNLLVGGAILSITINPLLFRSIDGIEKRLRGYPRLWSLLNARAERRLSQVGAGSAKKILNDAKENNGIAVVIGYGPVGQTVDRLLREAGLVTVIVDSNMDTIAGLHREERAAIFGDASREAILESAGIDRATHLVLTLPQSTDRAAIVATARHLNPKLKILVRARYLREREELEHVGATAAIFEEAEAAVALARLVLIDRGAGRERIENAVRDIRTRLILSNVSNLKSQTVRNIMVPWTRVRRLMNDYTIDEVRRQLRERNYSRWPVIDAKSGQTIGYLLAKDLIGLDSEHAQWQSLIRPLIEVRPADDIESTLLHVQSENATICLVRDQGGPLGILTLEDMLEQMFGRMEDEYPRHAKIELGRMLFIDEPLLHLEGQTSEEVIAEMVGRIPPDRVAEASTILKAAIAREHELPTNVGMGVAIPHARCAHLAQPIVVFGRSRGGVVFDVSSTERVYLIFLLLTPSDQPELQVHLLSQIAGIAGSEAKLRELLEASSVRQVQRILDPTEGV